MCCVHIKPIELRLSCHFGQTFFKIYQLLRNIHLPSQTMSGTANYRMTGNKNTRLLQVLTFDEQKPYMLP